MKLFKGVELDTEVAEELVVKFLAKEVIPHSESGDMAAMVGATVLGGLALMKASLIVVLLAAPLVAVGTMAAVRQMEKGIEKIKDRECFRLGV